MKLQIWSQGMLVWERSMNNHTAIVAKEDSALLQYLADTGQDVTIKVVTPKS